MKQVVIFALILAARCLVAQDFEITNVHVKKDLNLEQLVFTIEVEGMAGDSVPDPIGTLDGAPVLGYVFPTSLSSEDVGFGTTEGIVALALTSHPDFDDTPLWDENLDMDYGNDGIVWHAHWVILEENLAVPGGLAVKATDEFSVLPPTNPGMPMYMDSPGYQVTWNGHEIQCVIPFYRMNNQSDFNYDGVTALMNVNTSDPDLPMLGVYEVYSIASGDLSLPYSVGNHSCDTLFMDVSSSGGIGLIDPVRLLLYPNPATTQIIVESPAELDLTLYEIRIHTMGGAEVLVTDLDEMVEVIEVSDVGGTGTYVLSVVDKVSSEIRASKKVVFN